MTKTHALVSQIFMTFLMAALMSGLLGLIFGGGPSREWLLGWPGQFIVAWPIVFALTMVAWPVSVKLAGLATRPRGTGPAADAEPSAR